MADRRRRMTLQRKLSLPQRDFSTSRFCSRIQLHGLVDIYEAKTGTSKMFWGVTVAGFFALLGFGVYNCYNEYLNNPIITTLSLQSGSGLKFPPVYICPVNSINFSTQLTSREEVILRRYLDFKLMGPSDFPSSNLLRKEATVTNIHFKIENKEQRLSVGELNNIFKSVALDKTQFLRHCVYRGFELPCASIATLVLDPTFGACYYIKLRANQTQDYYGLQLLLDFFPEQEYPISYAKRVWISGASISVLEPIYRSRDTGAYISPGKLSKIDIATSLVKLIDYDRGSTPQRCTKKGNDEFRIMNLTYSRDICMFDCYQQLYFLCGCLSPTDTGFIKQHAAVTAACDMADEAECWDQVNTSTAVFIDECMASCYESCKHWTYTFGVSSMDMPSESLIKLAAKQNDVSTWRHKYAVVEIAYSNLEYWVTTQSKALSITELISNIGGLTGLWLGASMLTVVQLGAAACSFLYTKTWNSCRRRQEDKGEEDNPMDGPHASRMASLV